jgi:ribonuclease BN (tRNA processing enzyme)
MTTLQLQFAGSGDAFGSGGRFQTCMLLDAEDSTLALDFGTSSLVALARAGRDPNAIETVVITHLHADHFGGIPFLVLQGQFSHRERPLRIVGPPGTEERMLATMEALFPGSSTVSRRFPLEFSELGDRSQLMVGPWEVTPFLVDHPSGAPPYAVRVATAGTVIAYSGDTAWVDSLVDAAEGTDLFVCEAYFYEKRIPAHLSYRTVHEQADRLGTRHLVLTHMSNDMLARLDEVDLDTAEDGRVIQLPEAGASGGAGQR